MEKQEKTKKSRRSSPQVAHIGVKTGLRAASAGYEIIYVPIYWDKTVTKVDDLRA